MIIHACDLCGNDTDSYKTWVEVPVNVESPRVVRVLHPQGRDTTIVHLRIVDSKLEEHDLCGACFRDTLRRYLAEETKPAETTPAETTPAETTPREHTLACPAYGNYQPPYKECTCGAG